MEMLSLIAKGLIPFMERVVAGEKDPFPYPDALLCGFNQLILTCALRGCLRSIEFNSEMVEKQQEL
jgi:hypothetical protein